MNRGHYVMYCCTHELLRVNLFENAEARVSIPSSLSDTRILSLLRRANLDAFWSSEPSSVAGFLGHD